MGAALSSAHVDDVTATALAVSLADLLDAKFPAHPVSLEVCPKFKEMFEAGQETSQVFACVKVNELFSKPRRMPPTWDKAVRRLVVSLARQPAFLSYVSIPVEVWEAGVAVDPEGEGTRFPYLPAALLQDIEVLRAYIARIHVLGWSSRQQFEEIWMSLLGVLGVPSDNLSDEEVRIQFVISAQI